MRSGRIKRKGRAGSRTRKRRDVRKRRRRRRRSRNERDDSRERWRGHKARRARMLCSDGPRKRTEGRGRGNAQPHGARECIHRAGELWGQLSPGDNSYCCNKVEPPRLSWGANCSPKASRARYRPVRSRAPVTPTRTYAPATRPVDSSRTRAAARLV